MSRIDSYYRLLKAASKFQSNIALILEAKASEAERSSEWICHHLNSSHFEDHGEQLKKTMEVHNQLIEVIDSMTKMEQALARNMQVILGQLEDTGGGQPDGDQYGQLFPFGGEGPK